eukprot:TRINITY_DN22291_c2_g1_i2.p1 TRINITY_DN22291_c2_g1~~TRINITY_DN22291_c2_g1_i2.p1  ORF type:complete len:424 (+),score=128.67 TRINITY_DN22291_c2_g1_i2:73-1344(+)
MKRAREEEEPPRAAAAAGAPTAAAATVPHDGVYRVLLTGGPCGGKTAAMAHLRMELTKLGYPVYLVPEAATTLFEGGARTLFTKGPEGVHRFQTELLRTQLFLEDVFTRIARQCTKGDTKAVVLIDRGTMDGRVFCTPEQWRAIMTESGQATEQLRDQRYDLVLLFATTAFGCEEVFEKQRTNNPERTESAEEARAQEEKLREVYLGHPRLRVLDNHGTSWSQKLARALQEVLDIAGEGTVGAYRKYRVFCPPEPHEIPCKYETVDTTVGMLQGSRPEREVRLYKRESASSTVYMHQILERSADGGISRTERTLPRSSYRVMLEQLDPKHEKVQKRSLCFMWHSQYFELAFFQHPQHIRGAFLYTEMRHMDPGAGTRFSPSIPDWILAKGKVEDVTSEAQMSHYAISLKQQPERGHSPVTVDA